MQAPLLATVKPLRRWRQTSFFVYLPCDIARAFGASKKTYYYAIEGSRLVVSPTPLPNSRTLHLWCVRIRGRLYYLLRVPMEYVKKLELREGDQMHIILVNGVLYLSPLSPSG